MEADPGEEEERSLPKIDLLAFGFRSLVANSASDLVLKNSITAWQKGEGEDRRWE